MAKKKFTEYEQYDVIMAKSAEDDLNDIINFIAQNKPRTAVVIMDKIHAKVKTLDRFPYRGSYVPELLARNIKDYRQLTEDPWKIIYKINENVVNVLVIIDSRRNLQDILIKKLLK